MAQKFGMTELERKARAYADDKADKGNYDYAVGDAIYFSRHSLEMAYMAGARAHSAQWHDLRENPNDLPKENTTVLLLTEVEPVTARYDKKYESFFRMNDKLNYCIFIAPMSYIAWCEIPKFEEVEE